MSPDNEKKIPARVWLETHTQKELGFSSGLTLQPGANWWETPALFQWLWGVAVGRVTCMCKCVTMVPKPGGCVVDHSCCADWFGKLGPKRMHFDTRQTKTEIATIKKKKAFWSHLAVERAWKHALFIKKVLDLEIQVTYFHLIQTIIKWQYALYLSTK